MLEQANPVTDVESEAESRGEAEFEGSEVKEVQEESDTDDEAEQDVELESNADDAGDSDDANDANDTDDADDADDTHDTHAAHAAHDADEASKAPEPVPDFCKMEFWPYKPPDLPPEYTVEKVSYKLSDLTFAMGITESVQRRLILTINKYIRSKSSHNLTSTGKRETACKELGKILFPMDVVEAVNAGDRGFGATSYFLYNIFCISLRLHRKKIRRERKKLWISLVSP